MNSGNLLFKLFKDKVVEIFINNFDGETIQLSQFEVFNKYVFHGKVIDFNEECNVLILENHIGQKIYVNANNIDCFWEPGTKIIESISVMIPTGKKLKKEII